jgi:hypothetical protein
VNRADDAQPGRAAHGTDPRVLAMARAFDRTRRKVDSLDQHVDRLGADVARLAGVVTAGGTHATPERPEDTPNRADREAGPPAVRSWLLNTNPDQAAADLGDLIEWLDRVYLRYPGSDLAACWLWHPHVIEELWWLRRAHADAFHPQDGSWLRVGDWHDRQRPAAARRVRDVLGKCDLSLHTPGKPHSQPPTPAPLTGHAAAVAAAWATARTRPVPTTGQLGEAASYAEQLYAQYRGPR